MNKCCKMKYQYVDADASLHSQLDPTGSELVAFYYQSLKRKDDERLVLIQCWLKWLSTYF